MNDAPIVADGRLQGLEDQALLLQWSDFAASDTESDPLNIRIITLPAEGQLQFWNGQPVHLLSDHHLTRL